MANEYWAERQAKAQNKLTDKSIRETNAQLKKYYKQTMNSTIGQFEKTYNKLLSNIKEQKSITPADLYKLDSYWQMIGQTKAELQKLGDKEAELLADKFIEQYKGIHKGISIPTQEAFGTISTSSAEQMINQIWCADGKSWSDRVWENTAKLQQALNDSLIECVVAGKKTTELKQMLQEQFNVSYSRANTLVRTEMAHLQTVAAQERYKEYGLGQVEVWADEDERRCDVCGKLHQKRFKINATMPIPAHPNCRCCIVPVVEDEITQPIIKKAKDNDKNDSKALATVSKTALTQEVKNDILTEPAAQRAQQKVKELQQTEGNLTVYDKKKTSHIRHVKEILGVEEVDEAAWAEYEKLATEFLKKDIDGKEMDGFLSANGTLFKFEYSTGRFAILSKDGTISTFFVPNRKKPKDYWKDQIDKFKPKE